MYTVITIIVTYSLGLRMHSVPLSMTSKDNSTSLKTNFSIPLESRHHLVIQFIYNKTQRTKCCPSRILYTARVHEKPMSPENVIPTRTAEESGLFQREQAREEEKGTPKLIKLTTQAPQATPHL
jgi:hypothetical protein